MSRSEPWPANSLKAAVSYQDIVRLERFPVPREALREAVLNALVHRDYMVPAPVQIRVYDDKLVLWNPAVLPEGWSAETLLHPHSSQPHNPDVANAFFRAGEIEAWGRGIERIFNACRLGGAPEPQLRFDAGGLWMEFAFDEAYLRVVRSAVAGMSDPVTPQVTGQVTVQVTGQVTAQVQRLLAVMVAAHSRSELQVLLGLKHRDSFIAIYLEPALAAGWVEMTVPTKPTSRLQRYRLTPRGRAVLVALAPGKDSA